MRLTSLSNTNTETRSYHHLCILRTVERTTGEYGVWEGENSQSCFHVLMFLSTDVSGTERKRDSPKINRVNNSLCLTHRDTKIVTQTILPRHAPEIVVATPYTGTVINWILLLLLHSVT